MLKEMIRSKRNWIYAVFACFACMAVLSADLSSISAEAEAGGFWNLIAVNLKKLEYILPVFSYRDAIFAFLIFFFFLKTEERWLPGVSRWAYRIPAGLTAFFLVFGYSFRYTNSWDLIFMDLFHMAAAASMMAGFYFLFVRIYELLLCGIFRGRNIGKKTEWITEQIFEKHAFWGPFLIILLFWLPYVAGKFPGAAMPETLAEMRQYYWNMLNNYYPPFHTVSMSLIMELGNQIHSYTFGFFLNLLVQLAMLLSAFAYGFVLMKRWKTPGIFRWLALAVICIVQFFPMEATVVEKDVPYTACVIFLVLQLYELVRTIHMEGTISKWGILGMVLTCMGVALSRNEGFYLIFAAGIAMAVYAYRILWKKNRKKCTGILLAVLLPVLLSAGYQKLLLPACGVEDNGPKEALSIPFQQTARYVRDYGHELIKEDEEIIGRVLDYENLAERYDPVTSDPVKYTYHAESAQDLKDYFGLWFRQLLRHPGNAVEATMNNAYGWFYQEGYSHNYMMTSQIDGQEVRWEIIQPERLAGVRQVAERTAKLLSRIPVVNWFENAGFVSWMTILLTAVWIGSGRKKYLLSAVPLLVALLVCIAAPTFNYQMRYIMPVLFCVPFYIPMVLQSFEEK